MPEGELDPPLTAEVTLGEGDGPEDIEPSQLAEHIERAVLLFETHWEFAARMKVARAAGLPFSEVCARWSLDDLVMEMGWDQHQMLDRIERCPDCGVKPSEQLKPGGRTMGDNPVWKLEVQRCLWCDEREEVEAQRAQRPYKRRPPRVFYRPMRPGEVFYDGPEPEVPPDDFPPASEGD